MIKVKVYNKEDIVAFVVPKSVKFAQLKEKAFKKVLKAAPRPLPPLSCPSLGIPNLFIILCDFTL